MVVECGIYFNIINIYLYFRLKFIIFIFYNWDVFLEQVVFGEEIGCGVFGKVLKGIFRELFGIEVFIEFRNEMVDFKLGEIVVIKFLGGKLFGC